MHILLWLVPALPVLGFTILALAGGRFSHRTLTVLGVAPTALATVCALIAGLDFVIATPGGGVTTTTLWTWFTIGDFEPSIGLYLDALSAVMMLVVSFVSLVIFVYSVAFMEGDDGYSRFFAYMNLFVGSMLLLVLADNLLLLYLGWEGVGLCSYLLIGFWYRDPANGEAARKAFIVTRVGDTAMIIGLFLIFSELGTLQLHDLLSAAPSEWSSGTPAAVAAAALLLGGAVGKSAQLPLQTWLPDAMAGPTPVSALIHAATMVTAGVYLIARVHVLFDLAPDVRLTVGVVGAATLLMAGFSALAQHDIKRVLAYSTISQIGYMFLGLGVGAWSAAIFHLMTHAFFKALLFLGAGAVGIAADHSYDMRDMGGFRRQLPLIFWTFMIGCASLAALPLVTAGFYSKDEILWLAWSSSDGSLWLWAAGLAGVFLTSLYSFRIVFLVFFGEQRHPVHWRPGPLIAGPLVVLAFLSILGGFVEIPAFLGGTPHFAEFMAPVLPRPAHTTDSTGMEAGFAAMSGAVMLSGVAVAWVLFSWRREWVTRLATTAPGGAIERFWRGDWAMDALYNALFVRPYVSLAHVNRADAVDLVPQGVAAANRFTNRAVTAMQTGSVRWYASVVAAGAIAIIFIAVFV